MKKFYKMVSIVALLGLIGGLSYAIGYYYWYNPHFSESRTPMRFFWVYPSDLAIAETRIIEQKVEIHALSPTLFNINENGSLASDWLANVTHQGELKSFISTCHLYNVTVHPLISTGTTENAQLMLLNTTLVNAFIESLNSNIAEYQYDGINIDFEHLDNDMRIPFTNFFRLLKSTLPSNITLSIDAPAFTSFPKSGWGSWFDFETIGEIADYVMIMTYDAHGGWSGPGEVAPTSWVKAVLARMVRTIAVEKLFVGIPMYGYDWSNDSDWQNWGFGYNFFQNALFNYNGTQERTSDGYELHLKYTDPNGYSHEAYYCDADTTWAKEDFISSYPVAGYCYWHLSCGDPRYFS